ncbi:MAG: hypothetical protein JJU11_05990 [Candidatus Sumerlaeia bacterium]|nr:hypothetical protein [Candidatus Sumerlaeia bacterium]
MRHACLLMIFGILFGIAGAAEPPETTIEIPESGPWAVEPIPIDTSILAMPLTSGGEYTEEGFHIARTLIIQWQRSLARRMTVIPREVIFAQLKVQYPRQYDFPYPAEDVIVDRLKRMTRPTHILTGNYEIEGNELVIQLTLTHGDTVHEGTVRAPVGEDATAAGAISRWALGQPVFELSREEKRLLNRPYFGGLLPSFHGSIRQEVIDNLNHRKWDELKNLPDHRDLYTMERVWAAMGLGRRDVADALLGDEPPANGRLAEYLARVSREEMAGNDAGMLEEEEWLLARYPGLTRIPRLLLWNSNIRETETEAYQRLFENWYARSSQTPKDSLWIGYVYESIAWIHRGSGFADTVTAEGWQNFRAYMNAADEQLTWGLMEGGLQPYFVRRLITVYGNNSATRHRMHRLFDLAIEEYPESSDIWGSLIHFTRPRWGGSIEGIVALGDRAMEVANYHPAFLRTLLALHNDEAWFLSRDSERKNQWGVVDVYFDAFPDAKRQVREAIVALMANDVHDHHTAYGVYYAALFKSLDTIADGVELRPDLYDVWENINESPYYLSYIRRFFLAHYIHIGRWEEARTMIQTFKGIDRELRQEGNPHPSHLVFPTESAGDTDLAMVEALLGNMDRARQLIGSQPGRGANQINHDFTRVMLWDEPDQLLEEMARGARQHPESDIHLQLHALALAKSGKRAEARQVWERAEAMGRDKWRPLVRQYEASLITRR